MHRCALNMGLTERSWSTDGRGFTPPFYFNQHSDIDIMILANVPQEEISGYADKIYDMTYDFEMRYGIEINPSVQSNTIYNQWKKVYPFFANIEKDGVAV